MPKAYEAIYDPKKATNKGYVILIGIDVPSMSSKQHFRYWMQRDILLSTKYRVTIKIFETYPIDRTELAYPSLCLKGDCSSSVLLHCTIVQQTLI